MIIKNTFFSMLIRYFTHFYYMKPQNLKFSSLNRCSYQNYPYHMVDVSPWPILVSFSLFSFMLGAVMYMHGYAYGNYLLFLGLILTILGISFWLKDVIIEGTYLGTHTVEVQKGLVIAILLFIISEIFVFLSVFWAFFHSSLSTSISLGGIWPPSGIVAIDAFSIPLLNTFLLLSSGALLTYGHHALMLGNRTQAIWGTCLTLVFGFIFSYLQYFEYIDSQFSLPDSIFGTVFFASTGLHGIHVLLGTLGLGLGLLRIGWYHTTQIHHQGQESAITYWHFVDIIWLFLFGSVYYW